MCLAIIFEKKKFNLGTTKCKSYKLTITSPANYLI